jgi:hypothetical protein
MLRFPKAALAVLVGGMSVALLLSTRGGALAAEASNPAGALAGVRPRVNCAANTYWRTVRARDQRCPWTHSMLADVQYTRLRWSTWDRTEAWGQGIGRHYNCTPGGCRWEAVPGSITIHLTRARLCRDGRRIYTRATFSPSSGSGAPWTWSYYCMPRTTPQDPGGG